jgi:hypothetical protein
MLEGLAIEIKVRGFEKPISGCVQLEGFEEPLFLQRELRAFEEPLFLEIYFTDLKKGLQVRTEPQKNL